MFDGDSAQAGRRERLMRKREAKDAFTDKIGGDSKFGGRIAETPTSVPNSVFGDQSSNTSHMSAPRRDSMGRDGGNTAGQLLAADISTNFKQRVTVKRHGYEVEIWCVAGPIMDMASNIKRRTITFFADVGGVEDSYSVQIPMAFELEKASMAVDDFKNGHCVVSVPAVERNVFS